MQHYLLTYLLTLLSYLLTYLLTYFTYLLTPWCRILLEQLTGLRLVKKFPAFYGTRRFITALTSAHHLSLSWANTSQSIPPHPNSWRSIIILSSHLRLGLPSGLFPSGLWHNVESYGIAGQATDDNKCMRIACWITKATDTHPEMEYLFLLHCNNSCKN